MMISLIDIIFVIILLYFSITSAQNGFIKEVFGKFAFVFGIIGGIYFCGLLTPYLSKFVRYQILDVILSFMIIFTIIFLLIKILQTVISGIFKGEITKSLDHALGFFFGAIEGVLVISAILIVIMAQPWFDTIDFSTNCFFWNLLEDILMPSVNFVSSKFVA